MLDLHRALTDALPLAGSRQLSDGPTTAELTLEAEFTAALEPALEEFYRWPLRNGVEAVPEGSEAEVRRWILAQYADEAATAVLLFVLLQNMQTGVNVGGGLALAELGLPGTFNLTNQAIIRQIERFVGRLVSQGGSLSLVATTARELARQITSGRAAGWTTAVLTMSLGMWMSGRVVTRSASIAQTEAIRGTRVAMTMTYARNGIEYEIHRTQEDACPICSPLEGERYPVIGGFVVGPIPLHPNCRCYHVPDTAEWSPPEEVWTGE